MAVLTDDDVIQRNSSSSTGTASTVVSLPSGSVAGNSIVVAVSVTGLTAPSGFVLDTPSGGQVQFWRKPPDQVTAGETSWTFTGSGADVAWAAWEVQNMDPVDPVDVTVDNGVGSSVANGGTLSTGTSARNQGLSVWGIAAFVATKTATEAVSWSGYTGGFVETIDSSSSSNIFGIAAAELFQSGSTGTFSSTATLARSGSAANCYARVVTYRAIGAPVASPIYNFTGFEWGTHAGMGTTISTTGDNPLQPTASTAPTGTWGTSYQIGSGFARNGGYGIRFTQAGAGASQPSVFGASGPTARSNCGHVNVRVISATGQVALTLAGGRIMYDASTTKFGMRVSTTGTVQWESGTTPLNTWRTIQWRFRSDVNPWHVDWSIETDTDTYTDQTSPADLATAPANTLGITLGSTAVQTVTYDFDDLVMSKFFSQYPLGPHKVVLLKVDPAGTPSVSGTTGNFSVFTANGTLAAWNATNARNAVDEVPPTISASSDGVVQTAAAASDYMEFPMETYTLAADEAIAGVRMVSAMWGGTGTGTGQLGLRGWDGTTETTLDPGTTSYDADSLTAASATYPVWRAAFWTPPAGGWTQIKLDAAALRVGFSADATPDMGVSAIYLEVAIKKLTPVRQVTLEDPMSATADVYINPDSSASVSYVITNNDATRSVNFNYSITGTPQTPVAVSPSTSQTVTVNADNFGDISDLSLEPQ